MDLQKPPLLVEVQNFHRAYWLWIVLLIAFGIIFISFYSIMPHLTIPTILGIAFAPIFAAAVLWVLHLRTELTTEGINYRFFFLHLKTRHIAWKDIEQAYVRQYRPIAEYGGWGLRWSFRGYGQAINVSGKIGLQLELKDGRKLLLGTQQPEAIAKILQEKGFSNPSTSNT